MHSKAGLLPFSLVGGHRDLSLVALQRGEHLAFWLFVGARASRLKKAWVNR